LPANAKDAIPHRPPAPLPPTLETDCLLSLGPRKTQAFGPVTRRHDQRHDAEAAELLKPKFRHGPMSGKMPMMQPTENVSTEHAAMILASLPRYRKLIACLELSTRPMEEFGIEAGDR
jgi:hypothetical protein